MLGSTLIKGTDVTNKPADSREVLESIIRKAKLGLEQGVLPGTREFLKDISVIAHNALDQTTKAESMMNIKDCNSNYHHISKLVLGTVIEAPTLYAVKPIYGHLVGFSENTHGELLLKVKFGETHVKGTINLTEEYITAVHPGNVIIHVKD